MERVTSGYLFPDLLNCSLNISEYKDLTGTGGQTVDMPILFLSSVSNFGGRKKNTTFRLTC